ncbi:MAG: hypothetical protein R6U11_00065 [Bacteroidales bacterium]
MKLADLWIKLGLKDRQFKQGMDGAQKRTNKFGAAMKRVGGMIAGVFAVSAIKRFITSSVKAYDIQIQAERKLAAAIKAGGGEVKRTLKEYKRFASQLQNISTVGDEATLGMLSVAQSMGVTGDAAKLAVKEAIALSKAMGMNEQSAIRYTAALESGNSTMLARYLPTLRSIEGNAERAAKAHELLGNMFSQVTEEANSGLGPVRQLENAIGDLKETIGLLIVEGGGFIDWVKGSIDEIKTWNTIISDDSISALRKWILFLTGSKKKWKEFANDIKNSAIDISESIYKTGMDLDDSNKKQEKSTQTVIERIRELQTQISETKKLMVPGAEISIFKQALKDVEELEAELRKLQDALPKSLTPRVDNMQPMTGQAGTPQMGETSAPVPSGLDDMSGFLEQNAERTRQYMAEANEDWATFGEQLSETIQSGAVDAIAEFSTLIGELFTGDVNGESFFNRILGQMGRFLSTLGKMIIAYGVAMEAFQTSLQNIFSGVGALGVIAAGAALVAIGGGIASYASSAGSSGGASGSTGAQRIFDASNFPTGKDGMNIEVSGVLQGDNLLISNQRSAYRRRVVG